jgi:hypothetical protein
VNKELQSELITSYPNFFADVGKSPAESCMAFGCECGDGWYDLIRKACSMISNTLENPGFVKLLPEYYTDGQVTADRYVSPVFRFDQIKEKYGGLRMYYSISQPVDPRHERFVQSSIDRRYDYIRGYVSGIISYSEDLSEKVCEVCGQPGALSGHGWYSTLCPAHAALSRDSGYGGILENNTVVS